MAKHHAFVSCGEGEKLFRTVFKWLGKKLNHIIRMTKNIYFELQIVLLHYSEEHTSLGQQVAAF